MTWRKVTDTDEINHRSAYPIPVLVACWYDGEFRSTFVCQAAYNGDGWFQDWRGGSLGDCVVTHWQPMPVPPEEAEMLNVALAGCLP